MKQKFSLKVLGVESNNPMKELEIIPDPSTFPFGFNVIVTFKEVMNNNEVIYQEGEQTHCYNATEVHHLYNSGLNTKDYVRHNSAIESNIHKTGWTMYNVFDDIKGIEVKPAKKKHTDFHIE